MLKQTSEIEAVEGRLVDVWEGDTISKDDLGRLIRRLRKAREEISNEYFKSASGD